MQVVQALGSLRRVGLSETLAAILLCLSIAGCGRFGLDLLPVPPDGATDPSKADAGTDVSTLPLCGGGACACINDAGSASKVGHGICGCGRSDALDSDGDGAPDCIDFCPGMPDRNSDGTCACSASSADQDGDGVANCAELCPFDPSKQAPGACGCGVADTDVDGDGTPDCLDECPRDPGKAAAGVCGCSVSDQDTDLDGIPDCVDTCSGRADQSYAPNASCGVGYCLAHNTPSTCVKGVETACKPGAPLSAVDDTCDGLDDDCDGNIDEDFGKSTSCGFGVCAKSGALSCSAGHATDSCTPSTPTTTKDDTCDDIDDDCDGQVDEDVPMLASSCSTGACASTGIIACIRGELLDSCVAKAPIASNDATCDNIDDDCDGLVDEDVVAKASSCGVGVCARTGTVTCSKGTPTDSCVAGKPTLATDTTCNNQDEDCDGKVDDDYKGTTTSCGVGACVSSGSLSCVSGAAKDSCVAKTPATTIDDPFSPGNGIDDDCDGKTDEDVPTCNTTPIKYEAGSYPKLAVPGNCKSVTVKLWGGGGGGAQSVGLVVTAGGAGGPGGYATATVLVSGELDLYVGAGGASGCSAGGANAGSATYSGGSGGTGTGDPGADGTTAGGGTGGAPSVGSRGGDGHFGGGGGGQGSPGILGGSGNGGGGGAASVMIVNGVRAAVAGGGGGGGGAQTAVLGLLGSGGGAGGAGCKGNGQVQSASGGGGGGGGLCAGGTTQPGSGTTPAQSSSIPSGRAKGGGASCGAGGAGYAIVTFAP